MKKLTYIQGAFILTFTNLITGSLSFVYRIFLSKAIGSEGMGVYQLVFPLYLFFITLVSGGITTAVSKLVAEQGARRNYSNIFKIIKVCTFLLGAWSFTLCILIFSNAEYLSSYILKDSRTMFSIMVFTPAVFFISLSAILKGYFFGLQDVNPPAVIDILEKLIRLFGLLLTTYFLLPYGIEYVCAGALAAMAVGEMISYVLLFFSYRIRRTGQPSFGKTDSTVYIMGSVLRIAVPLSISGALSTILDMVSAVLIPMQLRAAGYSNSSALSQYGELTGMVLPLAFYPFIIVSSLGITLVPAITSSFAGHNWVALNKKCNDSLKITSTVGFAATALFIIFPWELSRIFFNCPDAGKMLYWMAFLCISEYWQATLFAILNGVGMQAIVLKNSIVNIIITILCCYFLIPLPSIGIYGCIIGYAASSILITLWNISALRAVSQIHIDYRNTLIKPFIAFAGMYIIVKCCNTILVLNGIEKSNMIISSFTGFIFFFIALITTGTFTTKQLKNTLSIK
ncbi:MAG: stage V sporulation protein B [Caulobacteraceae bacterium]